MLQFVTLRETLMADPKFREIVATIEFPPKRYFGQLSDSTVAERKDKCAKWVSTLVTAPKVLSSPILERFLGGPSAAEGMDTL